MRKGPGALGSPIRLKGAGADLQGTGPEAPELPEAVVGTWTGHLIYWCPRFTALHTY